MYISDLHLHGFKSFAHKTHVKFDNGITAIVGPNGCGKSNIVDALRWVLGEQRPSLLRSSSMSNVIFNGTAKRKALGMADVSLTFVNDKGILPVEYSELTITRRLYRSGESEYLINNTPCRLKDIMELFMDTGMSSDAYSVIELKMVEEILNDRNNDRRKLFEEAAGITKFKERRKQTIRKLDETLKDMQRLEDILVEIRKKVRSLELQAEKAVKAKNLNHQLENLDKAYNRAEFYKIEEELKPLKERIANAEREKQQFSKRTADLERLEEQARNRLIEKERLEAEAKKRVSQIYSSIRDLETSLKITKEKINNEHQVVRQHQRDIEQSNVDLKELHNLKESASRQLEGLFFEQKQSETSLVSSKETFSEVQQNYSKVRHDLYELEISISKVNQKLTALQSNRIKLESRLENSEHDALRISRDIENFEDEILNAKGELNLLKDKAESVEKQLGEKESELEAATRKKSELENLREEIREEIRKVKSRRDAVNSEISLMESLAENSAVLPSSVEFLKHNFTDKLLTVGDILQTSEELAPALEAALGDAIHYLVVDSLETAKEAADLLKSEKKGRATFIPLRDLPETRERAHSSLADRTTCESLYEPVRDLLLGNIALCNDLDHGRSLLSDQISSAVTLEGDLITAHHFYKCGSRNKHSGIRLGLKDKLNRLSGTLSELNRSVEQSEQRLDEVQQKLEELSLNKIQQSIRELQNQRRKQDQEMSRYQSGIQVYEKNIFDLKNRKESLSSNRDKDAGDLEELQPLQKEYQNELTSLGKRQEELKSTLQKLEDERAIAQNRYNDARLKHQDIENKTGNISKEIERAEAGIANIRTRLTSRENLMQQSNRKIIEYSEAVEKSKEQLTQLRSHKEKADEKLAVAENETSRQRGEINEMESELRTLRKNSGVNLELVHHLTMAKEKFEMQVQALSDHIWETYGVLIDTIEEELPEEMTTKEAKQQVSVLKQKLQRIGDVNPLAIQEFEEEKERLDFYESQIEDLLLSEKKLRQTIDEINTTATKRFNETFEQIRANFKNVFNTLFHEDDYCDLLIEQDAEDPLDAKIDIRANPKGKRPSSINQLSGGEKTLTAIALLFAIYLVKPSPFCVLDEVDAPLDDANIERFSQMIRKFSEDTQFIIITHNKKTMSKAEMMYGVTMPETGVSRLVGVKMDEVGEEA